MARNKARDYDAGLPGAFPKTFKGKVYEFAPEISLDAAMEWMERQGGTGNTEPWEGLDETQAEYTLGNMAVIFGEHFDELRKEKVGYSSLNKAYVDLLDEWGLWAKPVESTIDETLVRLSKLVLLNIEDKGKRAKVDALLDDVKNHVAALEAEVEDSEDEEKAENPA